MDIQALKEAYTTIEALEEQIQDSANILNTIYRKHKDQRRNGRYDSSEVTEIDWDLGYASIDYTYYGSCGGDEWSADFPLKYLGMSSEEMETAYLAEIAAEKEAAIQAERLRNLVAPDSDTEAMEE